jgi:hypothetical protein
MSVSPQLRTEPVYVSSSKFDSASVKLPQLVK